MLATWIQKPLGAKNLPTKSSHEILFPWASLIWVTRLYCLYHHHSPGQEGCRDISFRKAIFLSYALLEDSISSVHLLFWTGRVVLQPLQLAVKRRKGVRKKEKKLRTVFHWFLKAYIYIFFISVWNKSLLKESKL